MKWARARMAGCLSAVLIVAASQVHAQELDFDFRAPATPLDPGAAAAMRDLAERLIPVYQDADADRYLVNLSALQLADGDYPAADVSRQSLRDRRRKADAGRPVGRSVIYDIYAHAKSLQSERHMAFAEAFTKSFRDDVSALDDQDAYAVMSWLGTPPAVYRVALQRALDRQRGRDRIEESEAVALIWAYVSFEAYRAFGPLVASLGAEDERRRYLVDEEVTIPTADKAVVVAQVVRPRNATGALPVLLEFTVRESRNHAKECAAHGYVGVVAYTRAKGKAYPRVVPYQHDGDDARTVIEWIARQTWSDGRVGMFGEGYSGFTSWAAAKRIPPALKAIATSAAAAPGINFPMSGGIFQNSAYRWSLHMTNSIAADDGNYHDDAPWRALDEKWYRSGMKYRDMGRLFGKPNPIFIRWLNHPSYDLFWQKMLPYREEFARINIPVLSITGYFAESEPGDLYYFSEHHRYNPHAEHTLLIGPYDDRGLQQGPSAALNGYQVDAAAQVDLRELLYQWFDSVLKGAAPPPLLKDGVNYEVMGANEWRHVPSLESMAQEPLRYFLDPGTSGGAGYRLTQDGKVNARGMPQTKSKPQTKAMPQAKARFVQLTVSLVDRKDAAWTPSMDLVGKSIEVRNGGMFVSDPLTQPTEFSGLFSGELDFSVNKMDMDVYVSLYELLPGGEYVRLFSPTDEFRASYAQDRVHRHLLKAGERQKLTFKSDRITSRQLQAGSRLVMVLGIGKRPDREINYGLGNDVSEESLADDRTPVKVRWYGDSFIDIPVRR